MKSEIACDDFDDAFWDAPAKSIIREESRDKRVYDLEERTAKFGEVVIDFAKTIPQGAGDKSNHQSTCGCGNKRRSELCRSG